MKKIKDISEAIKLFEEAAINHAEATENGDYKTGNKAYQKKIVAISYLKEHNSVDKLLEYLNHSNIRVRLSAATYLLPKYEKEAIQVLEQIAEGTGILSFNAEMTISEWRKGNLKKL